jgi:hypothetical protein
VRKVEAEAMSNGTYLLVILFVWYNVPVFIAGYALAGIVR